HPRIRDRSVCLLVAIHPLPASEEGEFRNILLNSLAERTVRTSPANVLDGRPEAGLVCVISGLWIVQD
ncbi:MAG: hypothetical protein KFF72_17115, partial [Arthrospira sp. SH-MAG29]|nr:hypothetical protein [Arthrospira sp. SH-MAG29]